MSTLRNPDWHLLSDQSFRRRAAVETSHQMFRGEAFIVLSDQVTGQHLRLTERAQELWQMFDGRTSLGDIWEALMRRPAIAPTQGEIVEWVMQLVGSGLLLSDHDLDPKHLSDRTGKRRTAAVEQRFVSPLAVKIKLFDPSALVRVTYPLVAFLFTPLGGLAILALVITAITMAMMNAEALMQSTDQSLISQGGLLSLALAYPIMKGLHELAHCYALKRFGGEVREFGVMLLVMFPVPYVEASAASTLPSKYARMLVGAAGIVAEVMIAAIAMIIWLQIEPGLERALLFNFVLIGSISTIVFNGNPLLKFDAYFVLADWLEMPNLAQRSGEYLQDRFLSRVVGLRQEVEPRPGEARILAIYGVASLVYRMLLTLTIALIVSSWFYVFGLLLAGWAIIMGVFWPLFKLVKKGVRMARSQNRVRRAGVRLVLFLALVVGLLALVPLPFSARGEGRIVPVPGAEVSAATAGLLSDSEVADGAMVTRGTTLIALTNPVQTARREALAMNVAYLEGALERSGLSVAERQRLEGELEVAVASLANAEVLEEALSIRAPLDGRLSWSAGQEPTPGTYVFRGDRLGFVINAEALQIVAAIPAAYSGRAEGVGLIEFRLPNEASITVPFSRERIVDVGQQVPPELLSSAGGPVPEQPGNPGMALDARWIIWAAPDRDLSRWAGARVEARVDLGSASALVQARFHLRRLFLRVTRF